MSFAFFRDALWLNPRRVRVYGSLLIGFYCLAVGWILTGPGTRDPLGNPKGTDFVSFWTVSTALHVNDADVIYHPQRLAEFEERTTAGSGDFFAWAYPPTMLLIVYPLATLPYLWSLVGWLGATLAFYLRTIWRIIPHPLALWTGLAFPAVFVTVIHGQNSLLIAGLFGSALSLLHRRPQLAGLLIGLLTVKPQFGILIPVALVFGRHWQTAVVAVISAAVMCTGSLLFFGPNIWSDFLASTSFAREILEQGLVPYFKFQSVFAAIRLLGGSLPVAYATQAVTTTAAVLFTAYIWRRPIDQRLKNAVLSGAAPLATPFVLDYDLTLLALSAAWLAAAQMRGVVWPWEKTVLAATFLAPLIARPLANLTGVIVTPLIETALLAALYIRCQRPLMQQPEPCR